MWKYVKQAGAELCQAQQKLCLVNIEAGLSAAFYTIKIGLEMFEINPHS